MRWVDIVLGLLKAEVIDICGGVSSFLGYSQWTDAKCSCKSFRGRGIKSVFSTLRNSNIDDPESKETRPNDVTLSSQ